MNLWSVKLYKRNKVHKKLGVYMSKLDIVTYYILFMDNYIKEEEEEKKNDVAQIFF